MGEQVTTQPDVTESDIPESYVTDESKAWEMAHAGKDERDTAANIRGAQARYRDLEKQARQEGGVSSMDRIIASKVTDELLHDPNFFSGVMGGMEGVVDTGATDEFVDNLQKIRQIEEETSSDSLTEGERQEAEDTLSRLRMRVGNKVHEHMALGSLAYNTKEQAKNADNRAVKTEEWAGILHDNPDLPVQLREALVTAGADGVPEELDPQYIMQLKYNTDSLSRQRSLLERDLNILEEEFTAGANPLPVIEKTLLRVFYEDSQELADYGELASKDETTVGDLKEFARSAVRKQIDAANALVAPVAEVFAQAGIDIRKPSFV